jgi:hypothetical protein
MPGAPQELSVAILRMRAQTSLGRGGRPERLPRLDSQFQQIREPARCQRTTVFGWTMARLSITRSLRERKAERSVGRRATRRRGIEPWRILARG